MDPVVELTLSMVSALFQMPQTVPCLGFPSSVFDCAFAADFDLSLLPLPCDSEVPQHSLLSVYCETASPPPMFPSPSGENNKDDHHSLKNIKEEPFTPSPLDFYHGHSWETCSSPSDYSPQNPYSPDPLSIVKQEITVDLEGILQESECLRDIYDPQRRNKDSIIRTILENPQKKSGGDHQLLREVLKDTSFQRKYNLKPFDIGDLGTAFKSEDKMEEADGKGVSSGTSSGVCGVDIAQDRIEPMLSLAMEQLREDLSNTCTVLGIARGKSNISE